MNRITALLLLCPTLLGAQTRYASETLKLRAGASERARVLATVAAGAAVDVRDCERAGGEWCLVVFNAQRGFVEARLLDAQTSGGLPPLSTNALVAPQGDASQRSSSSQPHASASSGKRASTAPRSSAARGYMRGPRGGCYTYSASGRKRYVDRSLCD
jgi:uncharacterized protein YraI